MIFVKTKTKKINEKNKIDKLKYDDNVNFSAKFM